MKIYTGTIVSRAEARASGSTLYFTGKPCKFGHIDQRWTCSSRCKACQAFSSRNHYEQNKQKYRETGKQSAKLWYKENREVILKNNKEWRQNNKDRRNEYMREWRANNKELYNSYQRKRRKTPEGKMEGFCRNALKRCLKYKNGKKTSEILGYTKDDLVKHIESQFSKGMKWSNHGEWEIDHIVSVAEMIASGVRDPKAINSLSNLRPIWRFENRSKGGRRHFLI